jgi:hypothetical protein
MIFRNSKTASFIAGDIECCYQLPGGDDHTFVGVLRKIDGYWWFVPAGTDPLPCECLRDVAERLSILNAIGNPDGGSASG